MARPSRWIRATAAALPGRSVSATTRTARTASSQPASTAVWPAFSATARARRSGTGTGSDSSANSSGRPTVTVWPSTTPRTPAPGSGVKPVTGTRWPERAAASRAMACPIGCSDASSTAPESRSTSSSLVPSTVVTVCSRMVPVVSVPVLSKTTTRTCRAASSARALLTRMPSSAPRPTAASSAVGVARPSAQGHATTSTATAAPPAAVPAQPSAQPEAEGDHGQADHARDEDRGDPVGQPLRGRLGAPAPRRPAG